MKRKIGLLFLLIGISLSCYSQIELGVRLGANASRSVFDDNVYKKFNDSKYKIGYQAGIVAVFENNKKDKYALLTELYYSKIGRKVSSSGNEFTANTASYNYLHMPIMFRMRFKTNYFDWYMSVGPQISYWLGGKGVYEVFDPNYQLITSYDYVINFDEPIDDFGYMNMLDEYNRWQLGLSVGTGILLELNDADRIALDLRYYFGHTYLGEKEGGYIPNSGLDDNFESTNQSLELSVMYTFDIYQKARYVKNKYK